MTAQPLQLTVTLNGVNHPLASCRWVKYAPDGCAIGSTPGTTATDTDTAAAHFTRAKRDRDREHRRGVHYRLIPLEEWRQDVKPCLLGECSHREAA